MEWVNVKETDKLPESLEEVLFSDGKGVYKGYRFSSFISASQEVGHWYSTNDDRIDDVTHWMPLPTLPEEQHGMD